jgi:hypothetical protein
MLVYIHTYIRNTYIYTYIYLFIYLYIHIYHQHKNGCAPHDTKDAEIYFEGLHPL